VVTGGTRPHVRARAAHRASAQGANRARALRLPALELLCEVGVAGGSGLVAVVGEPAARVPEPRVRIEAVPARELGGVVFEHGAEPPEGTATLDRQGETRRQEPVEPGRRAVHSQRRVPHPVVRPRRAPA